LDGQSTTCIHRHTMSVGIVRSGKFCLEFTDLLEQFFEPRTFGLPRRYPTKWAGRRSIWVLLQLFTVWNGVWRDSKFLCSNHSLHNCFFWGFPTLFEGEIPITKIMAKREASKTIISNSFYPFCIAGK